MIKRTKLIKTNDKASLDDFSSYDQTIKQSNNQTIK